MEGSLYVSVGQWMMWLWWVMNRRVFSWWTLKSWFWCWVLFWGCSCLELGGVKEWTFGRVVSIVNVSGGFWEIVGTGAARPGKKSRTSRFCTPFLACESLSIQCLMLKP